MLTDSDSPGFFSLSPDQVGDQITDLERLRDGATIFYAVDPHEIFDFCLPVFGSDAEKKDIKRVADDQIALYEVFFKFTPAPILLREYDSEMDQMLWHVRTSASKGFNRLEAVQKMLERPGNAESVESYALKNFNVLLAAVMDVYTTGAERLRQIARRLSEAPPPREAKILAEALAGYRLTSNAEDIFERLLKGLRFRDAFEQQKIRNSAALDAKAIDKLIFVNDRLIQAYQDRQLSKPVYCLYLSSANRTSKVFHAEDVRKFLPYLNGEPFNFWRTRSQIFAAIVHAGRDAQDTIGRLKEFQKIQESASRIREAQRHTGGHSGEIQARVDELTRTMAKDLARKRAEAANLGLLGNVAKFQELTRIATARDEHATQVFLDICREFKRDAALEDMRTALRLLVSQSDFGSEASRSLLANGALNSRDPGRSVQYLPARINIDSASSHAATYGQLVELYTAHMQRSEAVKKLLEIYNDFLKDPPPQEEPAYEAIRCMLYLSFFTDEGNRKAWHLSRSLAARHKDCRHEFLLLAAWAARRLDRYGDAIELAEKCLRHNGADPRFHHVLALALHAQALANRGNERNQGLLAAIERMETAISDYQLARSDFSDLIGTCYNSLTYFRSRDPEDACFDLQAARVALAELKVYVPSAVWSPMHPEYYHTEANLEFNEYLRFADEDRSQNAKKLIRAQTLIDHALTLSAKEDYRVLKKDIENHILLLQRA